ncbi:MAG: S9 family peptidase [Candidatus Eremiobacteraeota bacterium]|nr:S9 family peptidase [Candidatus Eremiobacteraeota bacterium]
MSSTLSPAGAVPIDPSAAQPPVAQKISHETHLHDYTRTDDYFWLRQKSDASVTAYLQSENAYTDAVMKPTEALQKQLYDEMLSHIKQTDLQVPYKQGEYYYYSRTVEGQQYPLYARKHLRLDAPEEVTLDLNALARGHSFLGMGLYQVSDDGRLLAYSLDTTGYRQYTLHVRDLRTGKDLAEAIPRVDDAEWASDNKTLLYVTEDDVSKRNDTLWRHVLGTSKNEVVFHEADELYDVAIHRSLDRKYVFLQSSSKSTTETRYVRADQPAGAWKVVLARRTDHRYDVEHHDQRFLIRTNDGADDFRVVAAPVATPDRAHWTEIVPQRAGVHIGEMAVFERYLVLTERSGGFAGFEIYDFQTGKRRSVEFPETVHTAGPSFNREFVTSTFRFSYTSLVTPNSVFDLNMATGKRTLLKETEVPGYDKAAYASELRYATARDGTKVPLAIVYKRGVKLDGSAPLLLYGYGSYGISTNPAFSAARLALLDRGVIFVNAMIRGGGELGEKWRAAGNLRHKLNTFTDFVDSAEYLVAQKFTSKDRLAIQGGSAGGLLMGAVTNMRPDLFKAVLAQVPFVDVMNTMLDASLPLTTSEYLEWGNPNVKSDYDYMMQYSPYDNVKPAAYPAMLVDVSFNDSQVPYWEGAKLVARLRSLKSDKNPLLLKVNFGAGHGGASGRYDALKEVAFNYAFLLSQIAP